jgi:hypothetical protein
MAKKRGRPRGTANFVPPGTDLSDARERNRGGIQVENRALDFAEDLGRLLGTTQKKAEEWLGQRKALAERLAQIRDAADGYLRQLTGIDKVGNGRRPTAARKAHDVGSGRKRGRPAMTAAQRKAVGERMKKYWAARKKAAEKK